MGRVIIVFRKKTKHAYRMQEIMNVFIRNGFSHMLFRLGLKERITTQEKQDAEWDTNLQNIGLRLRLALQELGPTFIKLGQIASTRRDLVPIEIALELEKLQDHVETVPFEEIRQIIESELEETIENLFPTFHEAPLASASIGQVHIAHLETGEEVAIKIQRPHIQEMIMTDLDILFSLSRLMEEKLAWAKTYRIGDMVDEFAKTLKNELDYQIEGYNAERLYKQFVDRHDIHIPRIHWEYSTRKVLTMEMIRGIKVSDVEKLDAEGYDRNCIAGRIVDSMFQQVLDDGFFHADPHPGNIMILPNNVVAYLDFGMAGRLTEQLKFHFASLLLSLQKGDSAKMIKTFEAMDIVSDDIDRRALERDLDDLQVEYYQATFVDISLGKAFADMLAIAYRHRIRLPAEVSLVAKVILTLEGIIAKLDPSFSIMEAVEPYGKKLMRQRLNPKHVLQQSWSELVENVEIIRELPKSFKEMTRTIKNGKVRLDINISDAQTFLKRLDRITNQLSLSIILLAFSILMVGLIIGLSIAGQTTMLWRLPVIEVGSVVATLMFLYLLYAIFKSGRI